MKVFISWSGQKSLAVAQVLRDELPSLINDVEPFVSSEDIEKGAAWFQKIATELEQSSFAIICVTPENLQSRWLHFEAGALVGRFSQTRVAPLLIELDNSAVSQPLAGMQLTRFEKDEFLKLLNSINRTTPKPLAETVLAKVFERAWGLIKKAIDEKIAALPKTKSAPKRSPDEILDEILTTTRSIAANISQRPALALPGLIEEMRKSVSSSNESHTLGIEERVFPGTLPSYGPNKTPIVSLDILNPRKRG
jgi:hypothetical protein